MFFHDVTCKTRTTYKISTFFDDLSFLNPGSHLKMMGPREGILQILNFLDNLSKNFLHILHTEGGKQVDQECTVTYSRKVSVQANWPIWPPEMEHPQNSQSALFYIIKRVKMYMKINSMVFLKKSFVEANVPFQG